MAAAARIIVALVFIFSGFIKSIDPWGLSLKIGEYLSAFGLEWLKGGKTFLSVFVNSLELTMGLALLLGVCKKGFVRLALVVMTGFTLLTIITAVWEPVADCGCFGDAIKISNWQSVVKNVILLLLLLLTWFLSRERSSNPYSSLSAAPSRGKYCGRWELLCMAVFAVGVNVYSLRHLPMIDLLPFKVGTNIPMEARAGGSELKTTLVYKERATGDLREFSISDTEWYDSLKWEYVSTRIEEPEGEGKKRPANVLADFSIFDGNDEITERLLYSTVPAFLVVSDSPSDMPSECAERVDSLITYAYRNNYFLALATPAISPGDRVGNIYMTFGTALAHGWCSIDATLLKTMMRAHNGVVVLQGGVIVAKWNWRDIPRFDSRANPDAMSVIMSDSSRSSERATLAIAWGLLALVLMAGKLIGRGRSSDSGQGRFY